MKLRFIIAALLISSGAFAQNQIVPPALTPLRINSNSLEIATGTASGGTVNGPVNRFILLRGGATTLNTFIGSNSGNTTVTGKWSTVLGQSAGAGLTSARENTFIGYNTGTTATTGENNTFVGSKAGQFDLTGSGNTYIGREAGLYNEAGANNVALGMQSGYFSSGGSNNVSLGYQAGKFNRGNNNVFIGYRAGVLNSEDTTFMANKFIVSTRILDNRPLLDGTFGTGASPGNLIIYGKTAVINSAVTFNFPIGADANKVLYVRGGILADSVIVKTVWADYVFDNTYKLAPLAQVERYIQANKHLPNVPSATEIEKSGMNVGDIARLQQEKIEELTLYAIDQEKRINEQQAELKELRKMMIQLLRGSK